MEDLNLLTDARKPRWFVVEESPTLSVDLYSWWGSRRVHVWRPPTDVYETDETVVVRVEIAGMNERDFSISVAERTLIIRGVRPDTPERRAYHQMEISFGEFITEIELPCPVAMDRVEADYTAGFLRVVLPKERPQRISIQESDQGGL